MQGEGVFEEGEVGCFAEDGCTEGAEGFDGAFFDDGLAGGEDGVVELFCQGEVSC